MRRFRPRGFSVVIGKSNRRCHFGDQTLPAAGEFGLGFANDAFDRRHACRTNPSPRRTFCEVTLVGDLSIPVITLPRFEPKITDEAPHIGNVHAKSGASTAHHVFFNHDAAQIVGPIFERDLPNLKTLSHPGALDIRNVIEIDPTERLGSEILVGARSWDL